jgi:hypothetical protein
MPSRMGGTGAQICVERGLGGIVDVTPVAIEVWMLSWWNDQDHVGSGHGSRAPIDCARSRLSHCAGVGATVRPPRGSPSCQRAPHVPRAR